MNLQIELKIKPSIFLSLPNYTCSYKLTKNLYKALFHWKIMFHPSILVFILLYPFPKLGFILFLFWNQTPFPPHKVINLVLT